jgi:hypothetical protein
MMYQHLSTCPAREFPWQDERGGGDGPGRVSATEARPHGQFGPSSVLQFTKTVLLVTKKKLSIKN